MNVFEITIIIFLYLIWAQRSEFVRRAAMWLTRKRREAVRKITGQDWR